jgi:hypothetical protein
MLDAFTNSAYVNGTNIDKKQRLNNLATIFNNLITYIDSNGLYKQVTDEMGENYLPGRKYTYIPAQTSAGTCYQRNSVS